jgi:hypothetical protein
MDHATHTPETQLEAVIDEIQVEALAGLQLMSAARSRAEVLQRADRTAAEIVRLVARGRTRLLVIQGNKKAACGCNPQAA